MHKNLTTPLYSETRKRENIFDEKRDYKKCKINKTVSCL